MLGSAGRYDFEETGTRSDLHHEIGKTISAAGEGLGFAEQILLILTVRLAADTVGVDVAHQTTGNPGVIVQELAEALRALNLHAVDLATHVNHRAVLHRPELSQPVKMLKSKAQRIVPAVAPSAAGACHVIEQPGANRWFVATLNLGEVDICRRIWSHLAHENLIHFYAATGGRRRSRVGKERQKSHFGKNARPFRRLWKGVRSPLTGGGKRYLVDRRQGTIDKGVVGREEVAIVPFFAH